MDTSFFAFAILLASLSFCLTYVSAQRRTCEFPCPGVLRTTAAVCKDGYCVCTNQDYDYNTCLRKYSFGIVVVTNQRRYQIEYIIEKIATLSKDRQVAIQYTEVKILFN